MNILILESNPRKDLNLDGEIRELQDVIERARHRENLEVKVGRAVRPEDLQRLLLKHEPEIVHFCGHGTGKQGLVLQDETGLEKLVSTDALSNLFELCSDWVECVLLNACYSEVQANAMVQHIKYAIGMNHEIGDNAAIAFATGFYQALGYKQPIPKAYKFGCNAIQLQISSNSTVRSALSEEKRKLEIATTVEKVVIPEHLKPQLKTKPNLTTSVDKSVSDARENPLPDNKLDIQSYIDKALEKELARRQARPELKEDLGEQNVQPNTNSSSPKKSSKLLIGGILGGILVTATSILTFSSFFSNTSSPNTSEMTAEDYFARGADKHDQNNYRGAIEDYNRAIAIEQDDGDTYYERGHAHLELGEHKKAIEDFSQAIAIDRDDAEVYYHRGHAHLELEEYLKAIKDFSKAIAIDRNDADAYYDRGKAHFELGQYQKAIANFTQTIAIARDDARAYYDRGHARFELRDHQGAIEDYEKAAELFKQQGDTERYQETLNDIKELKPSAQFLKVYADSTEGTAFKNPENKSIQVRFEVDPQDKWLAIPENVDKAPDSAKGLISPKGAPNFLSNDDVPCPRYPLGALVVKSEKGECLAYGEQDSFELAPEETAYFLMNDVYELYEDNEGYLNVKVSRL